MGHHPLWRERKSGSASSPCEAQSHLGAGRIPLRKGWEYVKEYCRSGGYQEENGVWGVYSNHQALFDHWVVGGRFQQNIMAERDSAAFVDFDVPLHTNYVSAVRVKDVVWDQMHYKNQAKLHREYSILSTALKTNQFPENFYKGKGLVDEKGIHFRGQLLLGRDETEYQFMQKEYFFKSIKKYIDCACYVMNQEVLMRNGYEDHQEKQWVMEVESFIQGLASDDVLVMVDAHQ